MAAGTGDGNGNEPDEADDDARVLELVRRGTNRRRRRGLVALAAAGIFVATVVLAALRGCTI